MAFAEAGATEVEAENRKAEAEVGAIENLHGVIDDFVVQRAAAERVRMADESGEAGAGSTFVEESFESAGGAAEIHVAERGVGSCGWI